MNAVIEGLDETGTIRLKGELTIHCAPILKEALMQGMGKTPRITVNLEGVEEVDLACLQVLCSAHRTAVGSEKDLTITGVWPESFKRVVDTSGFSRGRSCRSRIKAACLWMTGGCL